MADVAFVEERKLPGGELPEKTDATEPDFIAEIISPDDTAAMVDEKVVDWIEAGARLIWLVYPKTKHVLVCLPDGTSTTIPHDGVLDGRDVFLGLRLPVASFLP
jgi:Uma2 family endonuclease